MKFYAWNGTNNGKNVAWVIHYTPRYSWAPIQHITFWRKKERKRKRACAASRDAALHHSHNFLLRNLNDSHTHDWTSILVLGILNWNRKPAIVIELIMKNLICKQAFVSIQCISICTTLQFQANSLAKNFNWLIYLRQM